MKAIVSAPHPFRQHRRRTAATAALALLLLAAPAAGKVWFQEMQGRVVRWDQRVSSTIGGCPGNDSCRAAVQGTPVYLRRGAPRLPPKTATSLRSIGTITADGRIAFRVPRIEPGRYHLVAEARIAKTDRLVVSSGTFRIRRR